MNTFFREITPLSPDDCFTVFVRDKKDYDFPIHCHDEYELNLIIGGKGVKRIVGYHMAEIGDTELVMVGGNIPHAWFTHHFNGENIHEVTVQFHKNLFEEKFLQRNQLAAIRMLLERSKQGILFSQEATLRVAPRIEMLKADRGFDSVLELMSILQELATSRNMEILSKATPFLEKPDVKGEQLEKIFAFIRHHYDRTITLKEVSDMANMPEVSFSRLIRKHTGRTFVEIVNDIRLAHASRLLINTTQTVAEISYRCGFNNLSYFNRVFKRKHACTPGEFRDRWEGIRVFI